MKSKTKNILLVLVSVYIAPLGFYLSLKALLKQKQNPIENRKVVYICLVVSLLVMIGIIRIGGGLSSYTVFPDKETEQVFEQALEDGGYEEALSLTDLNENQYSKQSKVDDVYEAQVRALIRAHNYIEALIIIEKINSEFTRNSLNDDIWSIKRDIALNDGNIEDVIHITQKITSEYQRDKIYDSAPFSEMKGYYYFSEIDNDFFSIPSDPYEFFIGVKVSPDDHAFLKLIPYKYSSLENEIQAASNEVDSAIDFNKYSLIIDDFTFKSTDSGERIELRTADESFQGKITFDNNVSEIILTKIPDYKVKDVTEDIKKALEENKEQIAQTKELVEKATSTPSADVPYRVQFETRILLDIDESIGGKIISITGRVREQYGNGSELWDVNVTWISYAGADALSKTLPILVE